MNRLIKGIKKRYARMEYGLRHAPWFRTYSGHARVFFPCCSLAEADAALTLQTWAHLHRQDKAIGLWQDCCGMPLIYAHATQAAVTVEARLVTMIESNHIQEIITPCSTCHKRFTAIFAKLAHPPKLTFLYDLLSPTRPLDTGMEELLVHHPCPARAHRDLSSSFYGLAKKMHLPVTPAGTSHPLSCCLSKTPASKSKRLRHQAKAFVTYCAHCARTFQPGLNMVHILQLFFQSSAPLRQRSWFNKLMNLRKINQQWRTYLKSGK